MSATYCRMFQKKIMCVCVCVVVGERKCPNISGKMSVVKYGLRVYVNSCSILATLLSLK